MKAGADIILFETVPSLKEAKVEAEIAEEYGYDYGLFSCLSENIICEANTDRRMCNNICKRISPI